jgi:tellurium resistance protein TerZ
MIGTMIELVPGQDLRLVDASGEPLRRVRLGVGWDKERTAGFIGTGAPEIDLDASAVQFRGQELFDLAFYNHLATRDGSVVHQGDNTSGRGEGDDEVVVVDLGAVYHQVDTVVLLVSSYQGHGLEWVHNAYCRIVDDEQDVELARITLTAGVRETGIALAALRREGAGWTLRALGEGIAVSKPTEAVDVLRRFL